MSPPAVIALVLAGLAFGHAAFWFGAFDPYRFAISAAGIATAALLAFIANRRHDRARPVPFWILITLAAIPIYLAAQLIPIPVGLLATLSPRAAETASWLGLASAPISIAPNASSAYTFRICTAIVLFLLIRDTAWRNPWWTLLPLLAVGTLEALLGFTQAASSVLVTGTYVNRNHYAFLLEIMIPFAVMAGLAILRPSDTRRAIAASALFVSATLLFGATIFSLSRAGFLSALLSLFVLSVLNLPRRYRKAGFGALAIGFIALFFLLPVTDLILRFSEIHSESAANGEGARTLVWKDSMPVIRDFPFFGTGLGGYETAVRRHQQTALMHTIGYAHNEYIQFFSELGIFGFALLVIPFAWILITLARNLEDPLAKAGISSSAAILLHCLVDFNLQVPSNLLALAWLGGICASLSPLHGRPEVL